MQPPHRNGKWQNTQSTTQCLIRVGYEPRRTPGKAEPETNRQDSWGVVRKGRQPSSVASGLLGKTNEGDRCRNTRKEWL